MSYTSARYCYRCCFPQQIRMKRAATSGQFHAPIFHARRVFRRRHSQLLHSAEHLIRLTCAGAYQCRVDPRCASSDASLGPVCANYISARYCYHCCFPQRVRMKVAAASGQFHSPIFHARRVFRRRHSQLQHSAERLNSTYLCRSLLMRRFNPLCALLVRCVVVAVVRRMSITSARYCYRCCPLPRTPGHRVS